MKFLLLALVMIPALSRANISKEQQFQASVNMVISNSTRPDVKRGFVVASPSRHDPNYYYDWVRDTALTMRALIDYYELTQNGQIKNLIFTWISAEAERQNVPSTVGLGEVKFNVDGSAFTDWPRPQNDGPALRALAMIKFARLLLKEGNQQYVLQYLYHGNLPAHSIIKKDLEYTAHKWREHSVDLWEEVKGLHFYTLLAQQVALQEGALLAQELRDTGAATFYAQESQKIAQVLRANFIDNNVGIKATAAWSPHGTVMEYKRDLDVAPLLALNHTYPYQKVFAFSDPAVRKYVNHLAATFGEIYSINRKHPELGVSIGRYPEDEYTGHFSAQPHSSKGNPWFLSTLALGEYSCLLQKS